MYKWVVLWEPIFSRFLIEGNLIILQAEQPVRNFSSRERLLEETLRINDGDAEDWDVW